MLIRREQQARSPTSSSTRGGVANGSALMTSSRCWALVFNPEDASFFASVWACGELISVHVVTSQARRTRPQYRRRELEAPTQGFGEAVSPWHEEGCPSRPHPQVAPRPFGPERGAQGPDDLAIPSFRTHRLKGDVAGHDSIWVNGNGRVTFRFIEPDVELVDYQDCH